MRQHHSCSRSNKALLSASALSSRFPLANHFHLLTTPRHPPFPSPLSQTRHVLLCPQAPSSSTNNSVPPRASLQLLHSPPPTRQSAHAKKTSATPLTAATTAVSTVSVDTLQLSRPNDLVRSSKRSDGWLQMLRWARGSRMRGRERGEVGSATHVDDCGSRGWLLDLCQSGGDGKRDGKAQSVWTKLWSISLIVAGDRRAVGESNKTHPRTPPT
ncbi:hypothetical protein BKA80DRAFT_73485 [Phyllosticta citrichinensis]